MKAELAFAVYNGIVQEVYTIRQWFESGNTFSTYNTETVEGRWEFVGNIAFDEIRTKFYNITIEQTEIKLIEENKPIFNIKHNLIISNELITQRRRCREIDNQ